MSQKRVLLVEREQILYSLMERHLQGVDSPCALLAARSVREAIRMLQHNDVELVVAEHEGPEGIDGLALLRRVQKLGAPIRVVLRASEHLEKDQSAALALGCSSFLVKPVPEERFVELISNMLRPIQGFSGRLVRMKLEDIVQMFCYRKDSTLLSVSHNGSKGAIYVENGGIVHAQCDSVSGVDAFCEIVGWESGEFLSQVILKVPTRTVFEDWQTLLMEGIRQRDEIRHALETPPASGLPPKAPPARVEDLHDDTSLRRIMIVDDSRFIRKIVQEIVESDDRLRVVGYATNGREALARLDELKPDLILLDWDMPVMKGSTTLMHIMIRSPCPVVILSGFLGGTGVNPFDLLCLGGVDFLRKPQNNWRIDGRADDLVKRIKTASTIRFERIRRVKIPAILPKYPEDRRPPFLPANVLSVLGSFVGGCIDLIRSIPLWDQDLPSAVVVLHDMQEQAIGAFIDYLDRRSKITVRRLESGESLAEGVCYIHPVGVPLELVRDGERVFAKVLADLPGNRVLDHFLISASKVMGRNLVAVLLSGGPQRGTEGLRAVKQVEGLTMVQDPMSSADPRMAEDAVNEGVVDYICAGDNIAQTFQHLVRQVASRLSMSPLVSGEGR